MGAAGSGCDRERKVCEYAYTGRIQGRDADFRDNFRVFDSMEEGVKGYFEFIQLEWYRNLQGMITAIEGNRGETVDRRVIPLGWGYIRG